MRKYGIVVEQLSPHGAAAVQAAERAGARTIVYRDQAPVAALVPMSDLRELEPTDPGESGGDPLLSLCGKCQEDMFVDSLYGEMNTTSLFRKPTGKTNPLGGRR